VRAIVPRTGTTTCLVPLFVKKGVPKEKPQRFGSVVSGMRTTCSRSS
jgi:hypothetical protein